MTFKPTIVSPGEAATVTQLAAHEFAANRHFRGLTRKQRRDKAHLLVDRLRPLAAVAAEIISNDKSELTAKVTAHHETFGEILQQLGEAGEDARALLEVIESAEARLLVAMAVVEGVGDEDDE